MLAYGPQERLVSGGEPATTNNRMEMRAAIEGLKALRLPCEVDFHTDSKYLQDGITKWVRGWKRNGWMTREKKPVKNVDLWQELDALVAKHKVNWHWLKGHAGHAENERCDETARAEVDKIRKRFTKAQLKEALVAFKEKEAAKAVSRDKELFA